MKRYGNLYAKIYDMDNLIAAHQNARKGKTHYHEVQMVDADPERYLQNIQDMLRDKTYRTSPYKVFTKMDKKKEREIFALPYYPDRIIQWAVVQILEPIWINHLVADTYSSLKGRGIHLGLKRLKKALRTDPAGTRYCLKLDIRKFYPSIDHAILKAVIRHKIKDPDVLAFLDEIIESADGVPIGNYLSQYFGNIYLSAFDHWLKETNHIHHYFRYCDDVVILAGDKRFLHRLYDKIELYLLNHLNLRVKENWQIFPTVIRGIDFLGYRFFGSFTLLRKRIALAMKRKLSRMRCHEELTPRDVHVIGSYHGWLSWCDSFRLSGKYLDPLRHKKVMRL